MSKPKTSGPQPTPFVKFDLMSTGDRTITLGPRSVAVREKLFEGELCDFYDCTHSAPVVTSTSKGGARSFWDRLDDDEDVITHAVLKVAKAPHFENDLVANEAATLKVLRPEGSLEEGMFRYIPKCLEHFQIEMAGKTREAVVMPLFTGYVSLADIMKAFPDGLDYRDVVWMFKRILAGLDFAHENGFVHGAVLPPHVLVHPIEHGAKLIDWSYSVPKDGRIKAMSAAYEAYYPPEVTDRKPVRGPTDIYMAAKCAITLMGKTDVPGPVRGFFAECVDASPNMRWSSAGDAHEAFDKLLYDLVGKPKYRKLIMPGATS